MEKLKTWFAAHKPHGATIGWNYGNCRECDEHVIAHAGRGDIYIARKAD